MSEKKWAMGPGQLSVLLATILSDIEIVDGLDAATEADKVFYIADKTRDKTTYRPNSYDNTCSPVAIYKKRMFRQQKIGWMGELVTAFQEIT